MNVKEWKIPYRKAAVPDAIRSGYGSLLSELLYLRNIRTEEEIREYLSGDEHELFDPFLLKDMDKAVARIRQAIENREPVAVFGDYDVDGITATCIVTQYLQSRGVPCEPYIPVREEEGYGLNISAIDDFSARGIRLIITVDCGITADKEVEHACALGLDVIITDHHECSSTGIPEAAVAVVDSKRADDTYPYKSLAGVGVALKLVCACDPDPGAVLERFCDLAAIGTVADVMPLNGENRYIVRHGLEKINRGTTRPGISAMLETRTGESPLVLTSSNISFSLAPRLNAAGRIGRPMTAVDLLLTDHMSEAIRLVDQLDSLNERRKGFGEAIWNDVQQMLAGSVPDGPIVLASTKWHQGVIGIVASRLAEQFGLPAILICLDGENGKGSCRSYSDFNLFNALSFCAEHLTGFGGHALAAGLNIRKDRIDAFRAALKEYYLSNPPSTDVGAACDYAVSDPELLSLDNVSSLASMEPFGNANPKPVMCLTDVEICDLRYLGKQRQHLMLELIFRGTKFKAIYFSYSDRCDDSSCLFKGAHVDVAFSPQVNHYRSDESVQLVVSDIKPHSGLELSSEILRGNPDALYFCTAYVPNREQHFIPVWKLLRSIGKLPETRDELLALCPPTLTPETFSLCLKVFLETGLLTSPDGRIFGACVPSVPPKVELVQAETMQKLYRLSRAASSNV